jgi:uncharacterized protein YjbI with pentapeptide repeats
VGKITKAAIRYFLKKEEAVTSEEEGLQLSLPSRPTVSDSTAWEAYWKTVDQPWRKEPEIDKQRQEELTLRRALVPDIEMGIYPFKGMELSRADVEWLLETHEEMGGPVDWNDENQRKREGLDLRGANLHQKNLGGLPLARMRGGLTGRERSEVAKEKWSSAAVLLEGADLVDVSLQGADLSFAQLQGADLRNAKLQRAQLSFAQLQGANLSYVDLSHASLIFADLSRAALRGAKLQNINLRGAQLQGADLKRAGLQEANLDSAQLQGADLRKANLENTTLDEITLSDKKYGPACLADVKWGNVDLAVIDWEPVNKLGEELLAKQNKMRDGKVKKEKGLRLREYREAVRANRQLAVALRGQGLNEEADQFAYRAQLLQCKVWRYQRKWLKYIFSWFLFLLAGYGYRPLWSLLWYLVLILVFASVYYFLSPLGGHPFSPDGALVFSLTSFHGRGFFPGGLKLEDVITKIAASEAVVGLLIEISFIATFTQRFFGK